MFDNNGYNPLDNSENPQEEPNTTCMGEDLGDVGAEDSVHEWDKDPQANTYNNTHQQDEYTPGFSEQADYHGEAQGGYNPHPRYNQPPQYNYDPSVPVYGVPRYATVDKKVKREKKPLGRGAIAAILVVTVVLSTFLGMVGGVFAMKVLNRVDIPAIQAPTTTITAEQLQAADSDSFNAAAVAAVGLDSVVEITTEVVMRGNIIMGNYVTEGAGSGVIISEDGYIVTNYHVIEGATKVTVRTRDTKSYSATIVGSDQKTDLAVLKIEAKGLKAATYGNSGSLVIGQPILAIGNPLGELGGTVTQGIISALDRELQVENQTMTLLQTDASVNPGNSGGGLFDGKGSLVGIVNAKSSGSGVEGLGFAIPIDTARIVIDELIKNGYVTGRAEAGIEITVVDETTAYLYRLGDGGIYISAVTRGGAAEKAGLQSGDRIVKIAGKEIKTTQDAVEVIQSYKAGATIDFEIERENEPKTVKVTLDEQKPSLASLF